MKVNIIYWTGSGNTLMIADSLQAAALDKGYEVNNSYVLDANATDSAEADLICLGCPAMSGESLEEYEFRPFYEEIKPLLEGKDVLLFGSYDWGEGVWMEEWTEDMKQAGANLIHDGIAIQWTPSPEQLQDAEDIITNYK